MKTIELYLRALIALFTGPEVLAVNTLQDYPTAGNDVTLIPTQAHAGNILVKAGASGYYDICGVGDEPIGWVESPVLSGDYASGTTYRAQAVFALGSFRRGALLTASATDIATMTDVVTAANGQIQALPATAGTYYKVGRTMAAIKGTYTGPVQHRSPTKVVVIAALTSQTTANATDLASAEALANAIKTDLGSITTALATPAELVII